MPAMIASAPSPTHERQPVRGGERQQRQRRSPPPRSRDRPRVNSMPLKSSTSASRLSAARFGSPCQPRMSWLIGSTAHSSAATHAGRRAPERAHERERREDRDDREHPDAVQQHGRALPGHHEVRAVHGGHAGVLAERHAEHPERVADQQRAVRRGSRRRRGRTSPSRCPAPASRGSRAPAGRSRRRRRRAVRARRAPPPGRAARRARRPAARARRAPAPPAPAGRPRRRAAARCSPP